MSVLQASPDLLLFGLLAGILLIYLECNRPGWVIPGCLGTIMVLAALHRFSLFPLSAPALTAIAVGALLLVPAIVLAKPGAPSAMWANAMLALAVSALLYGTVNLVRPMGRVRVHLPAAVCFSLGFGFGTVWLGQIAVRARCNKLRPDCHPAAAPGVTG